MEEVSVLIARSQSGDKEARRILIEKNLGLVRSIVRRFLGRGCDAEDLFQIGVIGLIKSVDNFDLQMGVRFSTYAVPMITGEIKRFLRDDGLVKVSRSLKEENVRVRVAIQKLQSQLCRDPSLEEVAREAELSVEDAVMAMEAGGSVESIYATVYQDDEGEASLADRIVRGDQPAVGSSAGGGGEDREKEELLNHMLLQKLLGELAPRDRKLIELRYFQNKTQAQAGNVLGISQVQVSRMEKKILRRLRGLAGDI